MAGNRPVVIRRKGIYGYIDTSGLFSKGHTVWNWHRKIGQEITREAKIEAPERSGALKKSIGFEGPDENLGPYSGLLEVKVFARRRYSIYVHEGVKGRIYPKNGKWLYLKSVPKGMEGYQEPVLQGRGQKIGNTPVGRRLTGGSTFTRFPIRAQSVAGQAANPFLARATDRVGGRHRWKGRTLRTFTG